VSTPLLERSLLPGEGGLNPVQLSTVVYAVAQADAWARERPTRRWWTAFFGATRAVMLQQQQPQPQQPQPQQPQQPQRGSRRAPQPRQGFTPQGFSNMVWALGKLRRCPGREWAAALYAAAAPHLPAFIPQGLANLALGLANMVEAGGLPRPAQEWADALVCAAEARVDGFSSQGLANLLWCVAAWCCVPGAGSRSGPAPGTACCTLPP
jgi:hypothetical protein